MCWQLTLHRYFKDYHSMLPILDPSITPNTYYQHAPFLFWVVISIGSRRYTRQPTLIQALAQPVTQLALKSIIVRSRPIERVKALILLLTWPIPSGPFYRDPSFLLGGTLLHMAMQCGLHAPNFSQDFSKTYLKLPEMEHVRIAEMWAYVVITYQRYTKLK
jgi:transcriptional regulatory protein LEU3